MSEMIVRDDRPDPLALMKTAVEKGFDTEQLKVLFDLHNKHNENQARQAFAAAKCDVQRQAVAVVRNKDNPQTHSKYADLEAIDRMIRPLYTEAGLSLDFSEADCPLDGNMRVQMIVTHRLGHTEERHIDLPVDSAGIKGQQNKTLTHAKASTFTYGQRYLTVAYFNIPITKDDDGNGGKKYTPRTPTEVATNLRTETFNKLKDEAQKGKKALLAAWSALSPAAQNALVLGEDDLELQRIAEEVDNAKARR